MMMFERNVIDKEGYGDKDWMDKVIDYAGLFSVWAIRILAAYGFVKYLVVWDVFLAFLYSVILLVSLFL
jgi:hypothetical protein